MTISPKAFLSHSHADKPITEDLARRLREQGVDAWLDKWEIAPGDSLTQKIFEEGLKQCALFVIMLSPDSVKSKWVAHELDVALVRRIGDLTRVVPVVARSCQHPEALRPLLRLDLADGIEKVCRELVDLAHGRWDGGRPPLVVGPPPGAPVAAQVEGLTPYAVAVAEYLAPGLTHECGFPPNVPAKMLAEALSLTPEQLNDAVDELKSEGFVKTLVYLGTTPFDFAAVKPTHRLGLKLAGTPAVSYNPEEDILNVAAQVVVADKIASRDLLEKTGLTVPRLNRAVEFLEASGVAHVIGALGCAPFSFINVWATPETRRFVRKHAR
jgi:hypothetical protein